MPNRLYKNPLLVDNPVFIDGVTRAGKFMLGKVISHFEGIDYFQYIPLLEHLPTLEWAGVMNRDGVASLLQVYVNQYSYERMIGRNLNTRDDDGSSILNFFDSDEYFERIKKPAYEDAVSAFREKKRTSSFLIHECLTFHDVYLKAFPKMKMINIQRHPVDLVHSWYKRGWGKRLGNDPLSFVPMFDQNNHPAPWYSLKWDKPLYHDMSEIDRVLRIMNTVNGLDFEVIEKKEKLIESLLVVCYEHIFVDPLPVIGKITNFLQRAPHARMDELLIREGIPTKSDLEEERAFKFSEINKIASGPHFDEFVYFCKKYEDFWKLKSLEY